MVKECRVVSYNKFLQILVFNYDGREIQITAKLDEESKTVFVKYKDKKYELVSKSDYEKYIKGLNKKKDIKINTNKDVEIENSEL